MRALLAVVLMVFPALARADIDEAQLTLRTDGDLRLQDGTAGLVSGVSVWVGLDPRFWVSMSAAGGLDENERTRWEVLGGAVFAIDVLRVIPFVEVLGGAAGFENQSSPAFQASIGADWLVSRRWSIGVASAVRVLKDERSSLGVSLRVGRRFELD